MAGKIRNKVLSMKREGHILYFIIGIYLIYTASNIFKTMDENPERTVPLFCTAAILFIIIGAALVFLMGCALLRNFYVRAYEEELEIEKAVAEGDSSAAKRLPSKGTRKYLDFMYKIFRIK